MKYGFLIIILISFSSCRTQKTAVSTMIHAENKTDSTNKKDSVATTEIVWCFSNDSLILDNPSFFNLIRISEDESAGKTIPKNGYIKITSSSSSSSTASKSSSSDTAKARRTESPKQTVICKNNWFLTATLSVLIFFFCQCWQYRKKIAEIFARLK